MLERGGRLGRDARVSTVSKKGMLMKKRFGRYLVGALGLLLSVALAATAHAASLHYTDVTDATGVRVTQTVDVLGPDFSGAPIGGGVVWSDFDNDGDDDLYFVDGIGCNRLFRNNGDSTFSEITDAAGASDCSSIGHGATSADYDNDGDEDLLVTNDGQNRLFKNVLVENGSLQFEDVTATSGIDNDGHHNHSTAVWGDYDQDGYLDLFVGTHFTTMVPLVCDADLMYHNNGNGTFTEVGEDLGNIAHSGVLDKNGCALGGTWSDYDNDGDVDLMVVNDFGVPNAVPNRLFRNDGPDPNNPVGWKMTDVSASSGFDYAMFGMGIGKADIELDGDFDYYTPNVGRNHLGRNNADGTFTDIALPSGCKGTDHLEFGGAGLVSWSPLYQDADHDGYEDLFFANGGAPESKYPGIFGPNYEDKNRPWMYRNKHHDNCGVEAHALVGLKPVASYYRTITMSDYDNDGDMDIMVHGIEGDNAFFRSDISGSDAHWLKVKVRGTVGNRDGMGARVQIFKGNKSQMREVDGEQSFLSINTKVAHFGLRNVTRLDRVVVTFLGGRTVERTDVAADQTIEVTEPNN